MLCSPVAPVLAGGRRKSSSAVLRLSAGSEPWNERTCVDLARLGSFSATSSSRATRSTVADDEQRTRARATGASLSEAISSSSFDSKYCVLVKWKLYIYDDWYSKFTSASMSVMGVDVVKDEKQKKILELQSKTECDILETAKYRYIKKQSLKICDSGCDSAHDDSEDEKMDSDVCEVWEKDKDEESQEEFDKFMQATCK